VPTVAFTILITSAIDLAGDDTDADDDDDELDDDKLDDDDEDVENNAVVDDDVEDEEDERLAASSTGFGEVVPLVFDALPLTERAFNCFHCTCQKFVAHGLNVN
jgi:hypothetical protein